MFFNEEVSKLTAFPAAFRARRTTYIASLEETGEFGSFRLFEPTNSAPFEVTSLESVVRRLQDACRDAHDDVSDMRDESTRLQERIKGLEDREKIWKAYAQAVAGTPEALVASAHIAAIQGASRQHISSHSTTPVNPPQEQITQSSVYTEEGTVYGDDACNYGKGDDCDGEILVADRSQQIHSSPLQLYSMSGQTTAVYTSPTLIPTYPPDLVDLASEVSVGHHNGFPSTPSSVEYSYSNRLETMGYSSAAGSVDSSIYSVDANMPSSDYTADLALHTYGSTSEFSYLPPPSRPAETASDCTVAPPTTEEPEENGRSRRRHTYSAFPISTANSASSSSARRTKPTRTPTSTEISPISNTLAVIKAQAFGNVRKTRARAKRVSAGGEASRAAIEILEARGLGLGLDIAGGVKRRKRGDLP